MQLPRMTPDELIEQLRREADEIFRDEVELPPHESTDGEASILIEEWREVLSQIADGAENPQEIARAALNPLAPLKPWAELSDDDAGEPLSPDETIRRLLKPRTV